MERVIERQLNWVRQLDGNYRFECRRGGERYWWVCRAGYQRECLRSITNDAANPLLSLDYHDEAAIKKMVREVMVAEEPVDFVYFVPAEVEPAVEKFEPMDYGDRGLWLGPMLVWAALFWGVVFIFIWSVI